MICSTKRLIMTSLHQNNRLKSTCKIRMGHQTSPHWNQQAWVFHKRKSFSINSLWKVNWDWLIKMIVELKLIKLSRWLVPQQLLYNRTRIILDIYRPPTYRTIKTVKILSVLRLEICFSNQDPRWPAKNLAAQAKDHQQLWILQHT